MALAIAAIIFVATLLWFASGDDVRSHQPVSDLIGGWALAAFIAWSHWSFYPLGW